MNVSKTAFFRVRDALWVCILLCFLFFLVLKPDGFRLSEIPKRCEVKALILDWVASIRVQLLGLAATSPRCAHFFISSLVEFFQFFCFGSFFKSSLFQRALHLKSVLWSCLESEVASKADAYTERWDEWDGRPNCEIPADLRWGARWEDRIR